MGKRIKKRSNGVIVGFIGKGHVLKKARKICDELGYNNKYYPNLDNLDCNVLFALRYKKIIPTRILKKIPQGVIIIHYGKLPFYRGYYPINQAIRNGEREIGITMFYANECIDAGDIIDQKTIEIDDNETVDKIYSRCNEMAIKMFRRSLERIIEGSINRTRQLGSGSLFDKKDLTAKLDLEVKDIKKLHNFIRSLTGKNQERAYIKDNKYRLYFEKTKLIKLRGDGHE